MAEETININEKQVEENEIKQKKIPNGRVKLHFILTIIILILAILFLDISSRMENIQSILDETSEYEIIEIEDENENENENVFDYEALSKLYNDDDIVMTIGDYEVSWEEYLYYYKDAAEELEYYMGSEIPFDEVLMEDGDEEITYADYPKYCAENYLKYFIGTEAYGKDNKIEMSDKTKEEVESLIEQYAAGYGVNTEEELYAELKESYGVPESVAKRDMYLDAYVTQMLDDIYGADGEKISDEDSVKYQEENGYMHAMHILLSNRDMTTYEELDEAALSEKKALAESILAELNAIEDNEERKAKFIELGQKYNEDSNIEYTFREGSMVEEFTKAARELEEYEVRIVETDYGYHVMMGVPLDPNAILFDQSATAKKTMAQTNLSESLMEYKDKMQIKYADGFTTPDLKALVK